MTSISSSTYSSACDLEWIATSRSAICTNYPHEPVTTQCLARPPTGGRSAHLRRLPFIAWAQLLEGVAMAEVRRRLVQDVREGLVDWPGRQARLERRGRLAWPRLGLHAEWYLRADEPGPGANPQARDRAHFGAPLHTPLRGGRRVWLRRPVRQDTSEFERDSQVQAPAVNGRIERFLDLLDPFDDGIPV